MNRNRKETGNTHPINAQPTTMEKNDLFISYAFPITELLATNCSKKKVTNSAGSKTNSYISIELGVTETFHQKLLPSKEQIIERVIVREIGICYRERPGLRNSELLVKI